MAKVSEAGREVFRAMLQVDSGRRPSAGQLLQLPYFCPEHGAEWRKAADEGRVKTGSSKSDPYLGTDKPGSYHPLQLPALPPAKTVAKSSVYLQLPTDHAQNVICIKGPDKEYCLVINAVCTTLYPRWSMIIQHKFVLLIDRCIDISQYCIFYYLLYDPQYTFVVQFFS